MLIKKYKKVNDSIKDPEFQNIELKIQNGNKPVAIKMLNLLIKKNKLGSNRLGIANLLRRAGQPYKSLIILRPLVLKDLATPKPAEIISYCAGLYQIGQSKESRKRLLNILVNNANLDTQDKLDALFHLGLLEMSEWNYHKASHHFENLIKLETKNSYRYQLSLLNLSSCKIFYGRLSQAEEKLYKILSWENITKYSVLKNSCLDGLAQIKIYQRDFSRACEILNRADNETSQMSKSSIIRLQIEKWKCVNSLFQKQNITYNLNQLTEISLSAKVQNYYELQRDCDFYHAFFTFDKTKLNQIYHGTSFTGFKKKLLYHCPYFQPTNEWSLYLQPHVFSNTTTQNIICIDTDFLKHWSILQIKTILLLLRDQYRPFTIGEIFSYIHPNEQFDPLTSSIRIRKHMWIINNKMQKLGFHFRIQARFNSFYITANQPIILEIRSSLDKILNNTIKQKNIIDSIAKRWITCLELRQITGWSKSKTHRWLQELIKNKKVKTRGTFKDKKYFFVSI